jgi:CcmD family protein
MAALADTLPLHTAGPYVAAAYVVFVVLIVIYVAIMAGRLSGIERELGELTELATRARAGQEEQ